MTMVEQLAERVAVADEPSKARVVRRARLLEFSVVSFVVLIGSAMALYPGGTVYDKAAPGHSFFQNFMCDLLHARALSGADNSLGSWLATLGMVSLIPGLATFVLLVPALVAIEARTFRALRAVALLACSLLVAVPLLPSDRYGGIVHAVAVLGAGLPATSALSVMVVKIAHAEARSWAWRVLSTSLIVAMFSALGLYLLEGMNGQQVSRALPVLARCATVLLVIWLFAFARLVRAHVTD